MDFALVASLIIYGFSTLCILVFLVEIQAAWENHKCPLPIVEAEVKVKKQLTVEEIDTTYLRENVIPISRKPILVKESLAISKASKSKSKVKIEQLRKQCESAGIEWKFARTNTSTNRKRHLTQEEMVVALNLTA